MLNASLNPRNLSTEELELLPFEDGVIKLIVVDGKTHTASIVECPHHGDIIAHTHGGKFSTLTVHAEHRINK